MDEAIVTKVSITLISNELIPAFLDQQAIMQASKVMVTVYNIHKSLSLIKSWFT